MWFIIFNVHFYQITFNKIILKVDFYENYLNSLLIHF